MKFSTLISSASVAGLVALASPALAQTAVTATADLNIRSGPGPQYPVVGVIPDEEAATIDGCVEGSSWCQVTYEGTTGWSYGDYLTTDLSGSNVVVIERRADIGVPVVTYEEEEEPAEGALAGAATGAVAGAVVGGPVGAAIGGAIGLATGAVVEADPTEEAITYVRSNALDPVYLQGEAVVGATLPAEVELATIPDSDYRYVYVNGQPVLVEPESRQVVYVVRD